MKAPVSPADFKAVIIAPTDAFCKAFIRLFLRIPKLLYDQANWMLQSDGSISDGFRKELWPAGSVILSASPSAPAGNWLECNGAAVSRTTYAGLYAALGTVYGAGDGSTTFNVPDLRGRAPIGSGTLLKADGTTSGEAYTIGQKIGEEKVVLKMENLPSEPPPLGDKVDYMYVHRTSSVTGDGGNTTIATGEYTANRPADNDHEDHADNALGDLGTDTPHENRTPSLVMRYWISY